MFAGYESTHAKTFTSLSRSAFTCVCAYFVMQKFESSHTGWCNWKLCWQWYIFLPWNVETKLEMKVWIHFPNQFCVDQIIIYRKFSKIEMWVESWKSKAWNIANSYIYRYIYIFILFLIKFQNVHTSRSSTHVRRVAIAFSFPLVGTVINSTIGITEAWEIVFLRSWIDEIH